MFYSVMQILHGKLPCSQNFFRLKKIYLTRMSGLNTKKSESPSRFIASPKILKGLSPHFKDS